MRIKNKHKDLIAHFLEYSQDKQIKVSDDAIKAFFNFESTGVYPDKNFKHIKEFNNLLTGKKGFDLFMKMLHEEVFYYWANKWGWAIPVIGVQEDTKNKVLIKILDNLLETIDKVGVIQTLVTHNEFSDEYKHRILSMRNEKDKRVF